MIRSDLFREVFEQSSIPQLLATLDISTTIQNKAFYEFIGYTDAEWEQNMTVEMVSHPDDYKKDYSLVQELIFGRRSSYQFEKRFYHKSGMELRGALNVSLISDPVTGERYIFGQVIDITEKYLMNESLRKSEEQYRLLAEHSSDIIALHDVSGTFQYLSPSFKTTTGHEPSDLVGDDPYRFIHPEDVAMVKSHQLQLLEGLEVVPLITYRFLKADGTYFWVETNIKAILDEKTNMITGLISVSRDIQQRIETEELLRKSEKLAVVGRMAAAVAHEIRNPLTPIKGFVTILSRTKEYNPMFVNVILSELKRIETIITDFLSIAKPNESKMELIEVSNLVVQVVNLVEAEAIMENKHISLELNEVPTILGDESALKQVLLNVLQNALDSLSEHGLVQVTIYKEEHYVCISVEDNGCGIAPQRLEQIGEPFYSTKEKGTGLGLMISYNIIQKHKGKIKITSQEKKGTTVIIYLPIS